MRSAVAAGLVEEAAAAQWAVMCQRRAGSGMVEASHARVSGSKVAAGGESGESPLVKGQSVREVLRREALRAMAAKAAQEAAPSRPSSRTMAEARPGSLASMAI